MDPKLFLLSILQKRRTPIAQTQLLQIIEKFGFSLSEAGLRQLLAEAAEEGYDIKTIYTDVEPEYSLVRYQRHDEEAYYRTLGNVETPFIISADQHIASKTFTEQGWTQLVQDAEEYSIKDIIMPGDIFQGRGVHSQEAMDVALWNISDQMDEVVKKLNMLPKSVRKHTVLGSHESHIKGSIHVGLDVLRAISNRISNFKYYGAVAKLGINNNYNLLFLHTSGGLAYAVSYKAQKIWEGLVERPNMLIMGHLHQLFAIPRARFNVLICGGTLQRENAYLINKGIIAQIGWVIIEKFKEGHQKITFRITERN